MSDSTLRDIQYAAVKAAEYEWGSVVYDLPGSEDIERYHRQSGAGWALNDDTYELSDYWCTVFIGYLYSVVGDYIEPDQCVDVGLREELGRDLFPSTLRLCGRWKKTWSDYDGVREPEIIDPHDIRQGDIVLESTGRTDRVYGDHGAIARADSNVGEGHVLTFEGNAAGKLGDMTQGEGVVKSKVTFSDIATVLRPHLTWFVGSWLKED
jgi:hypothetical protein